MNIFGEKAEKNIYPQCPCCGSTTTIIFAALQEDGWEEYVCGDCRKVFAIKGNQEPKVLGEWQ